MQITVAVRQGKASPCPYMDFYIHLMYNPDKHHRRTIRLKNHDYNDGFYYVTICCENRACIFGKIDYGTMVLNEYGKIALSEWSNTAKIRNNVKLHKFIVMPNHIHGILEIIAVGARRALPNNVLQNNVLQRKFQNQGKNTLPSIVGAYKSAVSKQIHDLGFIGPIWQRNYYEHIIRDEQSYNIKAQYIANNPANWQNDKFHITPLR